MILGSTVTFSSCVPLAVGAVAHYVAEHDAAVIQANGQRDAARIAAQGNNYQTVGSPSWEVFTCSKIEDRNQDGFAELTDRDKKIFYVDEQYVYAVSLKNCRGKVLKLFSQDSPDGEFKERYVFSVNRDDSLYWLGGVLKSPAIWHSYWTLDGQKIGENLIQVKERPYEMVGKK